MAIEDSFRELAARFRRINGSDARQEVEATSAWGAKLIRQAVESGLIDSIQDGWPESSMFPSAEENRNWFHTWVAWSGLLRKWYSHLLPSSFAAVADLDTGRVGFRVGSDQWRLLAEDYAAVADLLAEAVKETLPAAETTIPPAADPVLNWPTSTQLDWPEGYDSDKRKGKFLDDHRAEIPNESRGRKRYVDANAFTRYWAKQRKAAFDALGDEEEKPIVQSTIPTRQFIEGVTTLFEQANAKKKRGK